MKAAYIWQWISGSSMFLFNETLELNTIGYQLTVNPLLILGDKSRPK